MRQAVYPRRVKAWLESQQGRRIPVEDTCTIGRLAENNVVLDDAKVSRRHALVHVHGGSGCWLVDFGSRNGVFVNGRRVLEPVLLKSGDRVTVGDHELGFHQAGDVSARQTRSGARHADSTERVGENYAETGAGIIILNPKLEVTYATDHARRWMDAYFPEKGSTRDVLPPTVAKWLREELTARHPAGRQTPLTLTGKGRRLVIRLAEKNAEQVVLVFAEEVPAYSPERLTKLGLTERESEVLHWIIQGKSNPEVAIILGLSPRTVGSHVEHILTKLGVESRAAAVFTAVEKLG